MGACKALIPHLLLASKPPPPLPPQDTQRPQQEATTRRLLLFSLPLCTIISTSLHVTTSTSTKNAGAKASIRFKTCWALAESYDPVSQAEKDASAAMSWRVAEAVGLLEKGRELQSQGDFNGALLYFTQVVYISLFLFLPLLLFGPSVW